MAHDRGHTHPIVFAHACGYYLRAATNQDVASIQIKTVIHDRVVGKVTLYPVS